MADWLLACDGETLAWRRRAAWGRATDAGELRVADHQSGALCAAMRGALEGRARRGDSLRMVLGSLYMRVAALPWPRERLDAVEQQTLLRRRWEERLDGAEGWWLGVESAGELRLATAVRQDLLDALDATATRAGASARACLPAAGLALQRDAAADGCISVPEGPRETVITLSSGRLAGITSRWRAPAAGSAPGTANGGPRDWLDWL